MLPLPHATWPINAAALLVSGASAQIHLQRTLHGELC